MANKVLLEIKIGTLGCHVIAQITAQDKDFLNSKNGVYDAENGIRITCNSRPAFEGDMVYLRGDNNGDDLCRLTRKFDNPEEAEAFYKKVVVALVEFSQKFPALADIQPIEIEQAQEAGDIYTFKF